MERAPMKNEHYEQIIQDQALEIAELKRQLSRHASLVTNQSEDFEKLNREFLAAQGLL